MIDLATLGSQNRRVLVYARQAGTTGIDQTEFEAPIVCDGGTPIKRVAARIQDLEDLGCVFGTPRKRHKCQVYVLHSEPSPRVQQAPRGHSSGFIRVYQSMGCFGNFETLSEVCECGTVQTRLQTPGQAITGCRRVAKAMEQEVRHAEAA